MVYVQQDIFSIQNFVSLDNKNLHKQKLISPVELNQSDQNMP